MSIADRLNESDDFAEAWRPEKAGDSIVGTISDIGHRVSGYSDEPYTILTIKQENGERLAVHAFHFVLAQELRKYKLKYGTEIGIKYLGKPEGKNYERYKVVADAEFALGPNGESDPTPASDIPSGPGDFVPNVPSGVAGKSDDDIPF